MFAQPVIIIGIDDGELSLRQGYLPEAVAVAQPAIYNQRPGQEKFQPVRNRDGKVELNINPRSAENSEFRM